MACNNPIDVGTPEGPIHVPCGQCLTCRISKKQAWVGRCLMETMDNPASFLTLTYDDDHVHRGLAYDECQKFMKRLRRNGFKGKFICRAEYGETTGRPHFHLLLFGRDQEHDGQCSLKEWKFGDCYDAPINPATAGYVFGYNLQFDKGEGYTRYSTGNGTGQKAIGYNGFRRIGEIIAKRGYSVSPPQYVINDRWYPIPPYGKEIIENTAIELGATPVPKTHPIHAINERIRFISEKVASPTSDQWEHQREAFEWWKSDGSRINTNNRKAAQRGKTISNR